MQCNHEKPHGLHLLALPFQVPSGSVENAQFYDTAPNPHTARLVVQGPGHPDLLLVQGARHHHGIGEGK